jgi:hypothetical protein
MYSTSCPYRHGHPRQISKLRNPPSFRNLLRNNRGTCIAWVTLNTMRTVLECIVARVAPINRRIDDGVRA